MQKTAYDMRISDWSSDVCSSDLPAGRCQCAHNRESEPMSNKCHGCGRRPTACQCYAALSLRSDNLVGQPFDFRMGLTGRREHREAVMVTASAPDRKSVV